MTDIAPYQPLADANWPKEIQDLISGFAGRLNVYRVMAHNPALLRSWVAFREHVVVKNALGPQRSEVVILRTGFRLGSVYEWGHHVSRGRACGLTDGRIASLRGSPETMAPEDAVIVRAVDELLDKARLSASVRDDLSALVGTEGLFDVIATVGHYCILGFIVNSFETPLDDAIAAEMAAHPLQGL